jgi:hypothetical protein
MCGASYLGLLRSPAECKPSPIFDLPAKKVVNADQVFPAVSIAEGLKALKQKIAPTSKTALQFTSAVCG